MINYSSKQRVCFSHIKREVGIVECFLLHYINLYVLCGIFTHTITAVKQRRFSITQEKCTSFRDTLCWFTELRGFSYYLRFELAQAPEVWSDGLKCRK